ncbi:MAG: hypothetical protein ACLTXT_02465 [Ruminococcus callidus]
MAYREATQNKPIMVNNLIDSKTTISLAASQYPSEKMPQIRQ